MTKPAPVKAVGHNLHVLSFGLPHKELHRVYRVVSDPLVVQLPMWSSAVSTQFRTAEPVVQRLLLEVSG